MNNGLTKIVRSYRNEQGLSLREFAKELSEGISQDRVSHQSVHNWESGAHAPSYQMLVALALHGYGWRRDFAFDCLAAMKPDTYEPIGPIGRKILGRDEG
jgi:transcriptional regulator with XRE-family HTH domain